MLRFRFSLVVLAALLMMDVLGSTEAATGGEKHRLRRAPFIPNDMLNRVA